MLETMVPELQKDLEKLMPFEMFKRLREMFQQQVRRERFETNKALLSCKMAEGESVSTHIWEMKRYIDHLGRLGFPITPVLATGFDPKLAV